MIVETETAIYVLDEGAGMLQRKPRPEPLKLSEYGDLPPAVVADLRRDGESMPYTLVEPLEVGKPAEFWLDLRGDGVPTYRRTTHVVNIIND